MLFKCQGLFLQKITYTYFRDGNFKHKTNVYVEKYKKVLDK
jgi:hypothetical protein